MLFLRGLEHGLLNDMIGRESLKEIVSVRERRLIIDRIEHGLVVPAKLLMKFVAYVDLERQLLLEKLFDQLDLIFGERGRLVFVDEQRGPVVKLFDDRHG